ncbi:hypothetical protein E2C01_090162 [Portunus trituberculatus]|uniref:Uncharacterized protein n=1 Tax=Portunus trituberculatus TaxID=210409 RepID=A0A5B7JDY6_PORTR|nr:hypothetical protein [Portunus trituberculatus]
MGHPMLPLPPLLAPSTLLPVPVPPGIPLSSIPGCEAHQHTAPAPQTDAAVDMETMFELLMKAHTHVQAMDKRLIAALLHEWAKAPLPSQSPCDKSPHFLFLTNPIPTSPHPAPVSIVPYPSTTPSEEVDLRTDPDVMDMDVANERATSDVSAPIADVVASSKDGI